MASKIVEVEAKALNTCRFKFYKCACIDEKNNEIFETMVEVQIDTTAGKQHVSLMLTNEFKFN